MTQTKATEEITDLSLLTRGFLDPVIVISTHWRVLHYNNMAAELFKKLEPGALLTAVTRNSDLMDALEKSVAEMRKGIVEFTLKKPYKRTIRARLIPLPNSGEARGDRSAIFIHMQDMSEKERLATMRMHFIANASHELRTPLASVLSMVETLRTTAKNDPEGQAHFLRRIHEQSKRMARLIEDLLSLSRLEMNAEPVPATKLNMVELIAEVVDCLKPLAAENEVELLSDLPEGGLFVCGVRDELVQVAQNIIDNAIRYGGEGGKVWITAEVERGQSKKDHVVVRVRDAGPGIAPKHIPFLTDRFYRVDKTVSRNKGGTGLGLAIAKHVLSHHEGEIGVESKPDKGAVFVIRLPQCVNPGCADRPE